MSHGIKSSVAIRCLSAALTGWRQINRFVSGGCLASIADTYCPSLELFPFIDGRAKERQVRLRVNINEHSPFLQALCERGVVVFATPPARL